MKQVIVIGILLVVGLSGESVQPRASAAPVATMPPIASRRLICAVEGSFGYTFGNMPVHKHGHFVYHQIMNVEHDADAAVSAIAAAIGEPARARMLYCLLDDRARTSTELAGVADVPPSTASVHLQRLKTQRLVKLFAQGKHRYYSLEGSTVAAALGALSVLV